MLKHGEGASISRSITITASRSDELDRLEVGSREEDVLGCESSRVSIVYHPIVLGLPNAPMTSWIDAPRAMFSCWSDKMRFEATSSTEEGC